jgi:hypothetical protein
MQQGAVGVPPVSDNQKRFAIRNSWSNAYRVLLEFS